MPVKTQQQTGKRDEEGRFLKGHCANPAGRPPGSRNKATAMAEALLDGQANALIAKCIELALEGHPTAIKLCLERIVPRRGRMITLDLPPLDEGAAGIGPAMTAVVKAAAQGTITPHDGAELARVFDSCVRAMEVGDFERRLRELEDLRASRA